MSSMSLSASLSALKRPITAHNSSTRFCNIAFSATNAAVPATLSSPSPGEPTAPARSPHATADGETTARTGASVAELRRLDPPRTGAPNSRINSRLRMASRSERRHCHSSRSAGSLARSTDRSSSRLRASSSVFWSTVSPGACHAKGAVECVDDVEVGAALVDGG